MRHLSLDDVAAAAADIEALVDMTPDVDPWCSAPDWVLPAHAAFAPYAAATVMADDTGYALLARYRTVEGAELIAGLEPLWGFACPLIGPDPIGVARSVATHLLDDPTWSALAIPGLPAVRDRIAPIAAELAVLGDVGLQEGITRCVVDLSDGPQPWLDRRSAKFRRNLGNARRRGAAAGVRFEIVDDQPDLFERILAIEETSWKGRDGDGITTQEMSAFYRSMIERMHATGRTRCVIATIEGADVGYILGGVRGRQYRGLQLSYAQSNRELSLGHLLQSHEIRRLSMQDVISYDLGMDMAYKRRLADRLVTSVMLVVRRQPHLGEPRPSH